MNSTVFRSIFCIISITSVNFHPTVVLAGTVTVPYSVTFTAEGTIASGSYDNLGLFGGGDLVGLPFVNTITVVYPGIPWNVLAGGYYTGFVGSGMDSFTLNGHSYSFSGGGGAENYSFSNYDRRAAGLEEDNAGPYYTIRSLSAVNRSPPQWVSDPSGANIFSNNTVYGSASTTPGLFGIFVLGEGWQTNLELDATSIASTYTTTTVSVPEPSTWAMMLLGFAGLGYAGYRARRTVKAAV